MKSFSIWYRVGLSGMEAKWTVSIATTVLLVCSCKLCTPKHLSLSQSILLFSQVRAGWVLQDEQLILNQVGRVWRFSTTLTRLTVWAICQPGAPDDQLPSPETTGLGNIPNHLLLMDPTRVPTSLISSWMAITGQRLGYEATVLSQA